MPTVRFRLGGFPVNVEPSFWIVAVLFGIAGRLSRPDLIATWVAVVFVSILAHEAGHAVAFRVFGVPSRITLQAFGGVTVPERGALSPARSLAVSLAGPAAGLALAAITYLVTQIVSPLPGGLVGEVVVSDLLFVNVVWTVLNLAPVLPLDGGHAFESVADMATRGRGRQPALVVSVAVGAAAGVWALTAGRLWILFLAGTFTMSNWAALSQLRRGRRGAPGRAATRPGAAADPAVAAVLAALNAGRVDEAADALERFPAGSQPPMLLRALVAEAQGRSDEGRELLEQSFRYRRDDDTGADLAQWRARRGELDDAAAMLRPPTAEFVGARTAAVVSGALFAAGRYAEAAAAGSHRWDDARDPGTAFTVARSLARDGQLNEGEAWLRRAIDAGFDDGGRIDADPDLAVLRGRPEFERARALID